MAKIFLCHANEDKPQVRDVYQRLKAEGFEPWLDEEDLLPGQLWDQEIHRALRNSDFILIFFSQNSVLKRGYVQREMKLALEIWEEIPEGQIHTIPIRLDGCEIPERFKRFQRIDLFDERGFKKIAQAIRVSMAGHLEFIDEPTQQREDTTRVMLTIDMEFNHFDQRYQRLLQHGLAAFLEISPNAVRIVSIRRGSVIVTLELPTQSVEKLLNAYRDNNPELFRLIGMLNIFDLHPINTVHVLPLVYDSPYYTADLENEFFSVRNYYYLAIKVDMPSPTLIHFFESTVQISARQEIEFLRASANFGLRLDRLEAPPHSLPLSPGYVYFAIDHHHRSWRGIEVHRNIAVYCNLPLEVEMFLFSVSSINI
jgi:hypothetical protein